MIPSTKKKIPTKPSECAAAIALSEEGASHPYLSIFYTQVEGRIHFYGMEVTGTEENEDDLKLVYAETSAGPTTNPDGARPLAKGILYSDGGLDLSGEAFFRDEEQTKTYIAILRAVYQMQGEVI